MNNSRHAQTRLQQRCVPPLIVDLLDEFGTEVPAPNGAVRVIMDRPATKRLERHCGKHFVRENRRYFNAFLVIGPDGHTITAGWRTKRVKDK